MNKKPPKFATIFLRWFCHPDFLEDIEGDLEEEFNRIKRESGLTKATIRYVWTVLRSLRIYMFINRPFRRANTLAMLSNYFKIAFRMLLKQKGYTAIHLVGLTIGITSALLVGMYVQHELSFDRFYENAERIYRVGYEEPSQKIAIVPNIVGPLVKRELPQIEEQVRLMPWGSVFFTHKNHNYKERSYYSDPTFFDVFSLKLLEGNPDELLTKPNEVVLTESVAKKYFGEQWRENSPIGKTIYEGGKQPYKITGVMQDLPKNTSLSFNVLISLSSLQWTQEETWGNANYQTYIRLTPLASPKALETDMVDLASEKQNFTVEELARKPFLQPLTDIHTNASIMYDFSSVTDQSSLRVLVAIALLILLIACINYVNLATARAAKRAREVGVRKVMGAVKSQLFLQFFGEAILLCLMSFAASVFIAYGLQPYLNELTGRTMMLTSFLVGTRLLFVVGGVFLIAFIAGFYPAFMLTSYQPIAVLKSSFKATGRGVNLRKFLVVFQYSASILLIFGTFIVWKQLQFIHEKDAGFNKQVFSHFYDDESMESQEVFRSKLSAISAINHVSFTSNSPEEVGSVWGITLHSKNNQNESIYLVSTDEHYLSTCNLSLLHGNDFTKNTYPFLEGEEEGSPLTGYILNEEAAQLFGYENVEEVIGEIISVGSYRGEVIGIVKNFHFESLHKPIKPLVITYAPERIWSMLISMNESNIDETIAQIEKVFKELAPYHPFEYGFIDDYFERNYLNEQRLGTITSILSCIAIVIACLGLFGLTSYTAIQRAKEIGIRKVLGASVQRILLLLSKDYVLLLLSSVVIGVPISWFLMSQWLENFAFRIDLSIWAAVLPIIFVVLITLVTVSFHIVKTARLNPTESLRSE